MLEEATALEEYHEDAGNNPVPAGASVHAKKKRGRPRGKASSSDASKNRATRAPLLKHVISKKTLVHPHVIQKVLCELEDVCVEQVKTKGVFRMGIVTVMLREAREASVKLGGKDITKAKTENRTLQILPGKTLKKLCK